MELRELLTTLQRRWKLAVAIFLLALTSAFLITSAMTPMYSSTVRVYFSPTGASTFDSYQLGTFTGQRVKSYATLVEDTSVLERVIARAKTQTTPEALAKNVKADVAYDTVILRISVLDPNPAVAQSLAGAFAAEIGSTVAALETPKASKAVPKPQALITAKTPGGPSLASSPATPIVPLNLGIGALLGVLFGIGGAILRDVIDTKIKSAEEFEEVVGSPVMTMVPDDPKATKRPLITDPGAGPDRGEAYRLLRTNIQFGAKDSEAQMLVVTSPVEGEGKTSTAVNLALSLAEAHKDVLLVDGNLREPGVARLLGLSNALGVSNAIMSSADLAECTQRHSSGLQFLSAGPTPPNPSELLQSNALNKLLTQAAEMYEFVIIDTPALLPLPDASILAGHVGHVLLVTSEERARRDRLERAVARLELVDARVAGVVATRVSGNMLERSNFAYDSAYRGGEPAGARPVPRPTLAQARRARAR